MSTGEVNVQWDEIKAEERAARVEAGESPAPGRDGALAGVSAGLPALARALKLQQKAGKVGFDWNDPKAVLAKIREETDEIEAELGTGDAEHRSQDEVGDLLFAVVNLARHLDVDPESALRGTNLKFERRFARDRGRARGARQRRRAMRRSPRWTRCGMQAKARRRSRLKAATL